MATIPEALALAMQHHQAGRLAQAEQIYRQILQVNPAEPNALHLLGMLVHQAGQPLAAVDLIRQAVALLPHVAEIHANLGGLYLALGRSQEALASYREALRLRPDRADLHSLLGRALAALGRWDEALASYREALRLRPDYPEAHNNMGFVFGEMKRPQEAESSYRTALRLRPDFAEYHYNLSVALAAQDRFDEAIASCEQAVRAGPDLAAALNHLGILYKEQGRIDEAIACMRKAVAANPRDQIFHGNLLLVLHYHAGYDPETTLAEHVRWGREVAEDTTPYCPAHSVDRDPQRRLRIGYVSGDFWEHVMGFYSALVIPAHDRAQVEVFCYGNVRRPDALTARLHAAADHWRSLVGLSDADGAAVIGADRIDILIDLAGHTGENRLGVFARKPAPVQVTHCGYPATTGLAAIDYRLTDPYCDPPGQTERWHTETLMRLPEGHLCYAPASTPEVGALPEVPRAGAVTFASFNKLAKVTEEMIGLWSQILRELPESRLILRTGAGRAGDERVRAAFARQGIDAQRVTLVGRQSSGEYFRLFQDVHICLDTYPYTGCFTTADALWMGVPVVSRAGPSCVTRLGTPALVHAGLQDLIADTPAAYVETALRLAHDVPRLRELRSGLRERLQRSPLTDVKRFTRHLEAAYREMWVLFCRGLLP